MIVSMFAMCGRYVLLRPDIKELLKRLNLEDLYQLVVTESRYNIGPGQQVLAVRSKEGKREVVPMNWGMRVPSSEQPGRTHFVINARGETVRQRPNFRESFKQRRCVFPASGFYEWQRRDDGADAFLFRRREGEPFFLGGFFSPAAESENAVIVTTKPNETLSRVHDRMPVMLTEREAEIWLHAEKPEQAAELIRPFPDLEMTSRPVSEYVNDIKHEGERCWAPPAPRVRPQQLDFGL
jgi:putative SOS response-associated peptidase YedK